MYIGDLHIHSRYSRATSRDCTPEYLDLWARKKGIHIVGTGDFTHPAWREELKEKLEPAQDGLYVLKKEYRIGGAGESGMQPRFVVTGEISSIYKKGDRVRKVHSLLVLPGLEEAEMLARRLELIGNIHSDGRPILGIPCRDLLEIMLETAPEGVYVPAHIWTPHFSLFGAFSGFDRIEDCFEDLTPHIRALETGLSSDPPMIWRVGALDRFHLISNSDAHSPGKLGREANLFDIEMSYKGLAEAVQEGKGLEGTIEFFPEEGKYHYDGHRKCGLCISPRETERFGGRCPVCGKKITIGVLNRIEQLADRDREEGFVLPEGRPFESLVPLPEVIGASMGISAAGKKALEKYEQMLDRLGPEFEILREVPLEDIKKAAGPLLAEGIRRLRDGKVSRTPGFDGEYGKIGLLTPEDISSLEGQMSFFTAQEMEAMGRSRAQEQIPEMPGEETALKSAGQAPGADTAGQEPGAGKASEAAEILNQRQREAVERAGRCVAVIAGPGAGKTRTLIARLRYLLDQRGIAPEEITAVTFTNKAAEEMRARTADWGRAEEGRRKGPKDRNMAEVRIGTFHAICSRFLQEAGRSFVVADEGLQTELAEKALREFGKKDSPGKFLRELSRVKNGPGGSFRAVPEASEEAPALDGRPAPEASEEAPALDGRPVPEASEEAPALDGQPVPEDFEEAPALDGRPAPEASEEVSALDGRPVPQGQTGHGIEPEQELSFEDFEDTPNRRVYEYYQKLLGQAHALDYDDLLLETLKLLEEMPEDAPERRRFSYLLIDEFQDINPLQYRLVREWGRGGRELFVIGDPDQSIYGFRGCDPKVFSRLEEDYPDLDVIRLEENYRSHPAILHGALGVISHNGGGERRMKAMAAMAGDSAPVRMVSAGDERREAIFVAKEITRQIGGIDMLDTDQNGTPEGRRVRGFSDMAVLYRTHRQAALLEMCLRQEGIPYLVAGREDFLQEREVRASLYFFRHVLYPGEEACEALCRRLLGPLLGENREEKLALLAEKYRKKVRKGRTVKLLEEWCGDLSFENTEAMKKLTDMSVLYPQPETFLHTLSFGEDGDIRRNSGRKFTADAVTLMTLHGSKGLEFPVVFLYGMDRGRLPLEFAGGAADLQEERRLCYVGMTRAREELILVCGEEPSSFLQEIPPGDARRERAEREDKETVQAVQMSLFDLM
ncbi:MAG: UvrD-helicase domain-containing protein [Lachnospiraceae bacterium]|nr:UvrD-helicase domain-containing protein [Lachnospiraceae bacterium]